jgi:hypothetical protein
MGQSLGAEGFVLNQNIARSLPYTYSSQGGDCSTEILSKNQKLSPRRYGEPNAVDGRNL